MNEYLSLTQLIKMSADDLVVLKYRCEKYLRNIDEVIEQRYLCDNNDARSKNIIEDKSTPNSISKQSIVKKSSGKKRGRKPGKKLDSNKKSYASNNPADSTEE